MKGYSLSHFKSILLTKFRFFLYRAIIKIFTLIIFFIASCTNAEEIEINKGTLKIGVLLSGDENEDSAMLKGIQLAMNSLKGTINNKFEIVVRQKSSQWGQEADEAVLMVFGEGASGLIVGSGGIPSHLLLQVAGRTRIPVVSLCSDTSVTGAGIPWAVRILPCTIDEVTTIFKYFNRQQIKPISWIALVPTERAGREIANDIKTAANTNDIKIGKIIEIPYNRDKIAEIVAGIVREKPSAILIWLPPVQSAVCAIELRKAGYTGYLAGSSKLYSQAFSKNVGRFADGLVIAGIDFYNTENAKLSLSPDSLNALKNEYLSAMAFDAGLLLMKHLDKCDREHPYRGFPLERDFYGISGKLSFNKFGDRIIELKVLVFSDGKFIKAE